MVDPARGEPVNVVYLPNTAAPFGEAERERLAEIVMAGFPSATMQQGEGLFEGRCRPILMLGIRTGSADAIIALAQHLRVASTSALWGSRSTTAISGYSRTTRPERRVQAPTAKASGRPAIGCGGSNRRRWSRPGRRLNAFSLGSLVTLRNRSRSPSICTALSTPVR